MNTVPQLLRLMQLASPTLPVGTYAYSQGLEWAIEHGVDSESKVLSWIVGNLEMTLAKVDVPLIARLHNAWEDNDDSQVRKWSAYLYASRETKELRLEEAQTGSALARLLVDLGMVEAAEWVTYPKRTFATLFALAGVRWDLPPESLCSAYLWAWLENQIAVAIKTVPLGQTAGQRMLLSASELVPALVTQGLQLEDWEIGSTAPGQVMASALHETQPTRLFRS